MPLIKPKVVEKEVFKSGVKKINFNKTGTTVVALEFDEFTVVEVHLYCTDTNNTRCFISGTWKASGGSDTSNTAFGYNNGSFVDSSLSVTKFDGGITIKTGVQMNGDFCAVLFAEEQ